MLIEPHFNGYSNKIKNTGWSSFTFNCGMGYWGDLEYATGVNQGCSIVDGKRLEEMEDDDNVVKHIENNGHFLTFILAKTEKGFNSGRKFKCDNTPTWIDLPNDEHPFRETLIRDVTEWLPKGGYKLTTKLLKPGQLNIASFSFARTQADLDMFKASELFDVVWWSPAFANYMHPESFLTTPQERFPPRNVLAVFKAKEIKNV